MRFQLQPGTILDDRYRIDAVLGQGGFGITYAAQNTRIGLKVAVKELFWQGHSVRASEASPEVVLCSAGDESVFEAQKQRFLREARTLRDFSDQPGVVGVLDYFEANGTAYIVMEYVEGRTLSKVSADGPMPVEPLLRSFLPLISTLDRIHEAGIIHRDISPDNIMVQPDGTLKLIDFGAARQYLGDDNQVTAISRESFSPGEQYDKNGRQGPWTDVYALCATLYACVTGAPPQGAVQRMFLDELEKPSKMGIEISGPCEAILMKGLQLRPEDRYQSMKALSEAIEKVLPRPAEPHGAPRWVIWAAALAVLAAAVAVALILRRGETPPKFQGIATERVRFLVAKDVTASEFVDAKAELKRRLDAFSGEDNYIIDEYGTDLEVTLPLSAFDSGEIGKTLSEHFSGLIPGKAVTIRHEIQAVWEDPATSLMPGERQVAIEEMSDEGIICVYGFTGELTRGQRANLLVDFKVLLDALDQPYAFGMLYGDDSQLVIRMGQDHIGWPVLDCLGDQYLGMTGIFKGYGDTFAAVPSVVRSADGALGLRMTAFDYYASSLEDMTRAMLDAGMNTLYLSSDASGRHIIAKHRLDAPVTDGTVDFYDFCLDGVDLSTDQDPWLLNYIVAGASGTDLPVITTLRYWNAMDGANRQRLDGTEPNMSVRYREPENPRDKRLRELLLRIQDKTGHVVLESDYCFYLCLDLPEDDALAESFEDIVPELIRQYDLAGYIYDKSLWIRAGNDRRSGFTVTLRTEYAWQEKCYKTFCDLIAYDDSYAGRDAVIEWFSTFDWQTLGLTRWQ